MKYADIRWRVKPGDIIATSIHGVRSWHDFLVQLVRTGTKSEYAHVAMVMQIDERLMVIESVTPHVRVIPLSDFLDKGFYWIPLPAGFTEAEALAAVSMIGKARYSKLEAVMGFLKRLVIGSNKWWQCSEAVIFWRSLSGVDLGPVATPTAVVKAAQERYAAPVYFVTA